MPRNSPHRYPRTARVNEVLIEIIAEELARLSDPRLEMVTLTGAEVSTDLAYATLYYSALDITGGVQSDEQVKATGAVLHKATPHLRRVLGRQVRWRNTPALTFKVDPSVAAGQRIEELLRDIHAREANDE
jgi:ribosome-binding factor A